MTVEEYRVSHKFKCPSCKSKHPTTLVNDLGDHTCVDCSYTWRPEETMTTPGLNEIDSVLNDLDKGFDKLLELNAKGQGPIAEMLLEMRELMIAKGHDYSGAFHTFKNFEISGYLCSKPVDNAFTDMMAHKFSRLLLSQTRLDPPNFESLGDTWIDLANYIVLYVAWQRFEANGKR